MRKRDKIFLYLIVTLLIVGFLGLFFQRNEMNEELEYITSLDSVVSNSTNGISIYLDFLDEGGISIPLSDRICDKIKVDIKFYDSTGKRVYKGSGYYSDSVYVPFHDLDNPSSDYGKVEVTVKCPDGRIFKVEEDGILLIDINERVLNSAVALNVTTHRPSFTYSYIYLLFVDAQGQVIKWEDVRVRIKANAHPTYSDRVLWDETCLIEDWDDIAYEPLPRRTDQPAIIQVYPLSLPAFSETPMPETVILEVSAKLPNGNVITAQKEVEGNIFKCYFSQSIGPPAKLDVEYFEKLLEEALRD